MKFLIQFGMLVVSMLHPSFLAAEWQYERTNPAFFNDDGPVRHEASSWGSVAIEKLLASQYQKILNGQGDENFKLQHPPTTIDLYCDEENKDLKIRISVDSDQLRGLFPADFGPIPNIFVFLATREVIENEDMSSILILQTEPVGFQNAPARNVDNLNGVTVVQYLTLREDVLEKADNLFAFTESVKRGHSLNVAIYADGGIEAEEFAKISLKGSRAAIEQLPCRI